NLHSITGYHRVSARDTPTSHRYGITEMWECYNRGNMTNRTTLTETEIIFTNTQRVARLATADLDGHPHIVPVCYAYDGTHFYIPLDEKPKKVDESKLRRVCNILE